MPGNFTPGIARAFERRGFALVANIAAPAEIAALKAIFDSGEMARAQREGQTFGARNILGLTDVLRFAASPKLTGHLRSLMGDGFRPVRGIFFDKGANWPVLWHQDVSLAVKDRRDLPGWDAWSVKRGVPHVQAPASILERMVTVRLHLDDCPAENGPLRVIPASHQSGRLSRETIAVMTARPDRTIIARAGDALFMRPLILHASSVARAPHHRRVLQLEFAPAELLPAPLEWAEAV